MPRPAGFTLLELLVVLTLGAGLFALAVPAFRSVVQDARLVAAVNRVVHGVHLARHEALTTGAEVVLCRSRTGRQCSDSGDWNRGFIVFVNRDRDDPPRLDPGETLLQAERGLALGAVTANRRAFVFRPWSRSVNGTFTFCDERGTVAARAVVVSYTGRPRAIAATSADGASSCPG
ncbi:MAG: GspH/FimT family pseudopilin [Gammaproteobacteria bacterium]|nr:GspH/FimT family pseudopilin [Gammaproteobacteria bacterium]